MSTRLTPVGVADREIKRLRERESKLQSQLTEVHGRIQQWQMVKAELAEDAEPEPEPAEVAA
jgi:hypothetical protein